MTDLGPQRAYQKDFYDQHYAKRAKAVRQQLAHPLFSSFYDRLAEMTLDLGVEAAGNRGEPGGPVKVFEPGCGEGFLGCALQRMAGSRGLDLDYAGSDLSASALELAEGASGGDLRVGDASAVMAEMPEASRDVVVMKNLLHHVPDPAGLLREAARLVGPNGRVMALEPSLGCPQFWVFNFLAPRRERYYFAGQGRNRRAMEAAGLRVVARRRFSWLPYELAFLIRPSWFRRLVSTDDPKFISRVSELDDRLTERLPWFSCYAVWVGAPAAAGEVTKNT